MGLKPILPGGFVQGPSGGGGGGGAPSGPAGGDLSGTYPNPAVVSTNGSAFNTGATDPNITSDAQTGLLQVISDTGDPNVSCFNGMVADNTKRAQFILQNTGDGGFTNFLFFLVCGSAYSGGANYVGHGPGAVQFVGQGTSMAFLDMGADNDVPFTLFTNNTPKIVMSSAAGVQMQDVMQFASFTLTQVLAGTPDPTVYTAGGIIVSDATGGQTLCFSDQTNWISVKTGVPVA